LEIAEKVLYRALQTNKLAIETWARSARPGAKTGFFYVASSEVSYGVVRATGKLVQMRSVQFILKMEQSNGKLYYILTAYPVL